jgi:hypothetical protein
MSGSIKDEAADTPNGDIDADGDNLTNSEADDSIDENRTVKGEAEELDAHFKYSNDTSDLRLIVERKPLYVSRVVLSLVSPVMKR